MPSEERGGRWREGMREKDAEGRVRSRVSGGETRREDEELMLLNCGVGEDT